MTGSPLKSSTRIDRLRTETGLSLLGTDYGTWYLELFIVLRLFYHTLENPTRAYTPSMSRRKLFKVLAEEY
jgi:hypothetical protein